MDFLEILQEKLNEIAVAAVEHSPNILAAIALVILTWVIARVARKIVSRLVKDGPGRRSLTLAIRKLVLMFVWTIGLGMAAIMLFPSVKPSSLLAGLGLGSVAIGFAFKDIFENFFAGMLILLRQPFQLGDYIEVEGIEGKIENITVRDTRVRQTDGQPVVLPNSMLFKNPVTVRTDNDLRRIEIVCGVAYSEDIKEARNTIREAVEGLDSVSSDRPVQVFAKEFGASSIDFEVAWWTGSEPLDVRKSRDEVIEATKAALDNADIEIPFPYRTLTFAEPLRTTSAADAE